MADYKHFEDGGELSFFLRDDGSFVIVCNEGHAWVGEWDDALSRVDLPAKTEKADKATGEDTKVKAPSLPRKTIRQANPTRRMQVDEAPDWVGDLLSRSRR